MVSGLFFVVVDVVTLTLPRKNKQKQALKEMKEFGTDICPAPRASQVAIAVKTPPANAGGVTRFRFLGWDDP